MTNLVLERHPEPAASRPTAGTAALVALSLCVLMPSLDTSVANSGLPVLAQAFDASFPAVQWIVLAYLLATTALIVGAGRLGDLVGRRRLLLVGIALFTAASLACGLAPGLGFLIAARAAQGCGAAILLALSVALVGESVPKARSGSAMGLLGSMSAIGTTLGPSLGGLLIAGFGWRTVFLINLPLGVLNFALARKHLPPDPARAPVASARFDLRGTLLLAAALAAYALALTLGHGSFAALNVALLAGAVLGAGLFLLAQARSRSPLIRPELFRAPGLGAGLAMSALVASVMMSTLVVGPFYLSKALALSPAAVGFALSVGPLLAALAGVPAGRLVDRHGAQRMSVVGLAGMAAGCAVLSFLPAPLGLAAYLLPIAAITSSYALFQAANNTALLANAPGDRRGLLSGMLTLSRNLGLITGAAALGAIFATAAAANDPREAQPAAVAGGMRINFAVAALLVLVALALALGRRARASRASAARA